MVADELLRVACVPSCCCWSCTQISPAKRSQAPHFGLLWGQCVPACSCLSRQVQGSAQPRVQVENLQGCHDQQHLVFEAALSPVHPGPWLFWAVLERVWLLLFASRELSLDEPVVVGWVGVPASPFPTAASLKAHGVLELVC